MVIVWVAAAVVAILGIAALGVDMGFLYFRKSEAQKAADAAAVAGGYQKMNGESSNTARLAAENYAIRNGYAASDVVTQWPFENNSNQYHVVVSRQETLFFGRIFGLTERLVPASATAEFRSFSEFGPPLETQAGNDITFSQFGPDGAYNNGDMYSVRKLANGDPNPLYDEDKDGQPDGYNFTVNLPKNQSQVEVEIYDPDCYNKSGAGPGPDSVDELRRTNGAHGSQSDASTTRYDLYADNGTPYDFSDDKIIGTKTYDPYSPTNADTDMQWVTPDNGFRFNRGSYSNSNFRVKVTSTDGSSENGFKLRAGPQRSAGMDFDSNNGAQIQALGKMPINFNFNGKVDLKLGYIDEDIAGKDLIVDMFDTDVGARSVVFTCDTLPGFSHKGTLAGNGQLRSEAIPVPATYQGGKWTATYEAARGDTSVWRLSANKGIPGYVRLVGKQGRIY